ncbi:hypothetical protein SORBI_3001G339200 [Sorghum bicolor]|uniref:DUF4408 domain-containing protein n=1 Tax=Sorghum bicolor TaxID=4558 RepID=A0A1Z5S8Z5_SORBI|nr:hypothetical protein SORBI_3001G339200 [Sorghum bicolor]
MASVALLFSFSAILFLLVLLQAPPTAPGLALADHLVRFLDGRGLLELLATRRNMVLLCHAILLLILRDAGVLGAPARRSLGEATSAVAAAGTETIACYAAAPAPDRPHASRSAVVAPVPMLRAHDAAGGVVVVECRTAVLLTGPQQEEEEAKQIVVVESVRNNDDDDLLDHHDRADAVEPIEHPTTAIAADGERVDCDDRRIIAVAVADDNEKPRIDDQTAGMEMEMEMELADDRTFEEFIESQRRQMRREESLQLVRSGYHYQAIATCF